MNKKNRRNVANIAVHAVLIVFCLGIFIKEPSLLTMVPMCLLLIIPPLNYAINLIASKHVCISVRSVASCQRNDSNRGSDTWESCPCSVRLFNKSVIPLPFIQCTLSLVNSLNGEQKFITVRCHAAALSECEMQFCISNSHTGCVNVNIVRAEIMDIFGVLPVKMKSAGNERSEAMCMFLPKVFEIDFANDRRFSPDSDSCDYAPGKRGSDFTEVLQLRPYEEGDSIKYIHWKVSCKSDKLIVREASFPIIHSLLVLMDVNECTPDECDAVCDVTASVCSALHDAGSAFTLLRTKDSEVELHEVQPEAELLPAIEWLLECEPCSQAYENYVLENGTPEFGRVIFIGKSFGESAAEFCSASETKILLCGIEGFGQHFDAENIEESIRKLKI